MLLSTTHPRKSSPAGLTLIELLVVLSILAVVSTVALRSVAGSVIEQRYDANISQLEQLELAVLGSDEFGGFLGDIGRLPLAVGDVDVDNFSQLSELWEQGSILSYEIRTPAGDDEVRLGTGWRGPYLDLGINRDDLTDGFANRFICSQVDGTDANNGDSIGIVQSLGADDAAGGTSFDEDLQIIFEVNAGVLPSPNNSIINNWQSDIDVIVQGNGGQISLTDGANLILRVYGADGSGDIHTVQEQKIVLSSDVTSQTFILADLNHGSKIFRVYQESTDPATEETLITTTSPERSSQITHVNVNRFTRTITLTLF